MTSASSKPTIELKDASLTFKVRQTMKVPLKEFIVHHVLRRRKSPMITVRALEDIDLDVHPHERLGIIGHNGSGKSTLLKMLAGIYPPTGGACVVRGKISALFDLHLGFEWEASGWENIAFRGYLQGETPKSIKPKLQSIADFSELGEALEMPIRYFSAGMLMRLGFSIATAIEPEILLVDEFLSVGDLAFQGKARQRMFDLMGRAQVLVIVSHDLALIRETCTRVIWLDHGRIRAQGRTNDVVDAYLTQMSVAQAA